MSSKVRADDQYLVRLPASRENFDRPRLVPMNWCREWRRRIWTRRWMVDIQSDPWLSQRDASRIDNPSGWKNNSLLETDRMCVDRSEKEEKKKNKQADEHALRDERKGKEKKKQQRQQRTNQHHYHRCSNVSSINCSERSIVLLLNTLDRLRSLQQWTMVFMWSLWTNQWNHPR